MVSITLRVLSRPEVDHLSKIYQNLGLDYDERVLPSIGNEVLKATVAQFDAAELITQREVVSCYVMLLSYKISEEQHLYIGFFENQRGPPPACRGIQYSTGRCFYYPFDVWQSALFITCRCQHTKCVLLLGIHPSELIILL